MGLPRREYVDGPKYVCSQCRADVAGFSALVWEGFMGTQQPALLLRRVLNVERAPEVRRERLTSGVYELASVRCRLCQAELGWRYLSAASQDQCYKVGCELVRRSALILVLPSPDSDEEDAAPSCDAAAGRVEPDATLWPDPWGLSIGVVPQRSLRD
ncbi:hypothetical protein WJX81_004779 [Elliptochloris bilobata]|uniref:Protein yippee-like n=1 Tax=Elliptochloris bilobata TaxID=381761 RepID=A0AAW1S0Z7_9CHLO